MRRAHLLIAVPSILVLAACEPKAAPVAAATPMPAASKAPSASPSPKPTPEATLNPFFQTSTLPLQYPPFDKIKDADYAPAFDKGMADQRKEVDAIANDPAAPTFENTIVALEKSGQLLTRVNKVFTNLSVSNTDDAMEKVEADYSPKLAAHQDAILLDPKLFGRVDAIYQQRKTLNLDPESSQVLERYEQMFLRAGAKLSDADKTRLKKINEELSTLTTQFRQNVLAATKDGAVVVDEVKELDGLSPEQIGAAAEAAKARGLEGKWVVTLQNTTVQPPLEQMKNRALRERVFKASVGRGLSGKADNTDVVAKVVALRAEKAKLLGYPNWAAYQLADETAQTPAAVNKMLGELAPMALKKAKEDAKNLQHLIDAKQKAAHEKTFTLEPWDWAFYQAQVRKARFDFDDSQVKPYFEMNRVLQDGVFYAAHELYGVEFKERHDLPVYDPDVRTFDVIDADGSQLGILLLDYYKRDNKQGGAWMDTFVDQSTLLGTKPVVINNLNIPKPAPGEPALLTFDDVNGMFHEFGHALHGLFASQKYPLISGTNVPRDFVEFPSQFNEMWAREPKVLANYAKHYKTGEPLPKALFEKILAASTFDAGFATSEYLEAAMLDQAWHQIPMGKTPAAAEVAGFDDKALAADHVLFAPVPPRYHTTYFNHVFSTGYDACYYAYIWSEVLARDSGAWFHAHGGLTRANGDTFRKKVLSQGRSKEPEVLFEDFYGKKPEVGPLLEYRGLVTKKKK